MHKEGQIVEFDNGRVKGIGRIRGIATIEMPVVGHTWIVEVIRCDSDALDAYEYSCIPMLECHIKPIEFKYQSEVSK